MTNLIEEEKIENNWDYFLYNRENVITEKIMLMTLEKFKNIMKKINCHEFLRIIDNTWIVLLSKFKELTKKKLSTINKFPFWDDNNKRVNLKKILTPIMIRYIKDRGYSTGDFLYDETQFLI